MPEHRSQPFDDAWFDRVPWALLEFDVDGRVLRANAALRALLGYAALPGTRLSDGPRALQKLCGGDAPLAVLSLQAEAPALRYLVKLSRADGEPVSLGSQIWAHPRSLAGQPRRFLCAIQEIQTPPSSPDHDMDIRIAQEHLTLQADRTRAILDSVFVGIVTLDDDGIVWMNRSARRMFSGDLADFVGAPLSTVAPPDLDHPFRLTDYLDELRDGESHTFECQVVARDGRIFWVVGNAVITLDEAGQRHTTYALLDIDRRREAEARTAEAQATLQRIIEMAPMAIQLWDAHHLRLIQANRAALEFQTIDLDLLRADMQEALASGQALQREHAAAGPDLTQRTWDVNYLPLAREGMPVDQLLIVASDVTGQRAAEQARLEAAIAQRERLVREVHHRIKNNLQGVAGLLQQIAARKPEVASVLSEAVSQVNAIAQVYGLQVGAGGPLHLQRVVEAIATSVQRTFGRPITLTVSGPHAHDWLLPEAESIPIALSLNELLTNAHKHGPGTAPLSCTLHASDQAVQIELRNPGHLPDGFNVDRVPSGVSGLGLVRALMPRRSARLSITQDEDQVLTRIELQPPCVNLSPPPPKEPGESAGQQAAPWSQSIDEPHNERQDLDPTLAD